MRKSKPGAQSHVPKTWGPKLGIQSVESKAGNLKPGAQNTRIPKGGVKAKTWRPKQTYLVRGSLGQTSQRIWVPDVL